MWVPKDPTYFNNQGNDRDIAISYSGSPKKNRLLRIRYLEKNGISVLSGGGERQEHRATAEYANIYKRSKIALSFSRANLSHVVNARPFEAMLCGAMLLEQENFELPKMYVPFVDYVPYVNNKDLLRKTRYYLVHEDERKKIAKNGTEKTRTLYSAERFWDLVIEKAIHPSSNVSFPVFKLSSSSLTRVPWYRSFILRVLDSISCSATLFSIYKRLMPSYYKEILVRLAFKIKPFLERRLSSKSFNLLLEIKRKLW